MLKMAGPRLTSVLQSMQFDVLSTVPQWVRTFSQCQILSCSTWKPWYYDRLWRGFYVEMSIFVDVGIYTTVMRAFLF